MSIQLSKQTTTHMSKNSFEILTLKKPNITDFAKERNGLLENSKAEWVFFLDTDEKMSVSLKKEIEETIKSTSYSGFYVYRKNYFCGQYVGKDKIVRLGRRDAGRWAREVHETWQIKENVGDLRNPLLHNTATSVAQMIRKLDGYSSLHAKANQKEGRRSSPAKIIFYPKLKFAQSLLMGRGVVFSILQAFHSYLAWSKLWLSQRD